MRISKKTSKLRVSGLCAGNPTVTGEFPAQMASKWKMFPFDDVIMSEPSGLFPLNFLIVINDMHKNLWRKPGSEWFINCAHGKYIFLVKKVYIVNYLDMVSNVQVEMYPLLLQIQPLLLLTEVQDFTQKATQAASWFNFEWPAQVTGQTHWRRASLHCYVHVFCINLTKPGDAYLHQIMRSSSVQMDRLLLVWR